MVQVQRARTDSAAVAPRMWTDDAAAPIWQEAQACARSMPGTKPGDAAIVTGLRLNDTETGTVVVSGSRRSSDAAMIAAMIETSPRRKPNAARISGGPIRFEDDVAPAHRRARNLGALRLEASADAQVRPALADATVARALARPDSPGAVR